MLHVGALFLKKNTENATDLFLHTAMSRYT